MTTYGINVQSLLLGYLLMELTGTLHCYIIHFLFTTIGLLPSKWLNVTGTLTKCEVYDNIWDEHTKTIFGLSTNGITWYLSLLDSTFIYYYRPTIF